MTTWWLLSAALAVGADKPAPNPFIAALARCLEIEADGERLACTDAAAARLVAAERAGDMVAVSREDVRKTKRSLFGLPIDGSDIFAEREPAATRIDRLETTVAASAPTGYERWSLVLAEGGRWRTTEPWPYFNPKPGTAVVIQRAPMGGYVLTAKSARVRVVRVD